MQVLFISPDLTMNEASQANIFFNSCVNEVENYLLKVCVIRNSSKLQAIISTLDKDSMLVIFNNDSSTYKREISRLLDLAKKNSVTIWPVAMNKDYRVPPSEISSSQSYDVFEQLRCRDLNEDYLKTVGLIFARKIISNVLPTFYSDSSLIFVSHRRLDGEEITAKLCDQLSIQSKSNSNFRDVANVEVGQEAQEVIDSALGQSDVLIFIHTEKSAESLWIEKELTYAILNNIPIVWVKIDNASDSKLRILPSHSPHIECISNDFNDKAKLVEIIDTILEKSFELIILNSFSVYDKINAIKELFSSSDIELIEEDKVHMIYKLVLPRRGYIYPQRDINYYIQYFGRRCKDPEDFNYVNKFLENKKFNKDQLYDATILLSDKIGIKKINDSIVEENYDDFYKALHSYVNNEHFSSKDEIIISGSFPNCDETYKYSLYSAVTIFAKEILKNGFKLTFGSHPTFQNIMFEIGKKIRPNDYQSSINMFISKHFKNYYDLSSLSLCATVTETEDIEGDLLKSLSKLREVMIGRPTVKALICLGGVIRDGDVSQGIDEEIKIAKSNNIPVFLIGSVGGRSTQLSSEYMNTGSWHYLNKESESLNSDLALSLDYVTLANKIIDIVKSNVK